VLKRALLAAVVLAAVAAPAAQARRSSSLRCEWPMFGHDAGRSFAQQDGCSSVTPTSAPTLYPKWYFPTADATSASPAIVDGHVYVGDWSGTFYSFATDPPPGPVTPEWTFKVDDTSSVGFGRIVSSAAYTQIGRRKLVLFGGGATLYALDATTGAKVASVCVDPRVDVERCATPGDQVEIESSPAIVKERNGTTSVLVGMDVHNAEDVGRTGMLKFTLTADSLTPVWKFDPEEKAAYSGPGLLTQNSGLGSSGCAGVWGSPAVDVRAGMVFFGTASCLNAAADTVGEHVWGVDLATGAHVWNYGPHDGDTARYDDDFGGALNLLPGGRVGAGSKDGWYYALDERTGALAWKTQVGQPGHASAGFAVGGILASPAVGLVNGEPAVFAATAISTPNDQPFENGPDSGVPSVVDDPGRMFSLHAIRVSDGAILWRGPASRQAYGPPTYVNGVVLVPSTFDFQLVAVDADTGLPLAARPLPGPPSSAPTAYGDSVYGGVGTSTGEGSPLAPLSGVYAFRVVGP
jgi:polyvinyl alcohol dehydrogenase (cytochrome)